MIKEFFINITQNKNLLMFFAVCFYILGLIAFFYNCEIVIALAFTVLVLGLLSKNYISWKIALSFSAMFYFAFLNANLQFKPSDDLYSIAPVNTTIQGQIISIPNSNFKDKSKFFFLVEKVKLLNGEFKTVNTKAFVTVKDEKEDFSNLKIGNYYTLNGALRRPFESVNPSQFDYGNYLRNFNTFTLFYAKNSEVMILDKKLSIKWGFLQSINNIRQEVINSHSKYLKSPNLEILGGIVFGDDAVAPPEQVKTSFMNSGLLHILAASGMNVAFIYGFWFFLLRKLKVPFKFIVVSGIGVVSLYALMTGLGAAVLRATLMLIFILVGKLIDKDTHSIALLSFVALLLLIYNPAYINDVSFQLSFVVTFGLLTTADVVFQKFKHLSDFNKILLSAVLIPVIAQIWVAPIQMFYFNTFCLYSVLANIAIAPFLYVISFGGFVSSVLAVFKPISDITCMVFDFFLNPIITILVNISNFFSNLNLSVVTTPKPSGIQIILYYLIILLITLLLRFFNKRILMALGLSVFILACSFIKLPSKNLEIITFAVENADAFLIKTPQNKYFIIDTGKAPFNKSVSQARAIILSYLKDNGINNIEALILTHFDTDHAGGAVDLMREVEIKQLIVNSLTPDTETSKQVFEMAKTKEIPVCLVKNNSEIYSESLLKLKTFNANLKQEKFENENSIITLLNYEDFSMLFMGDAGIVAFENLKENLPRNIKVLKLGHHGAKDVVNKLMLEYFTPNEVIISTGVNNYGHPSPMTMNILRKTKTLRTDETNSILIKSNGNTYSIFTYSKNNRKYIKSRKI